MEYEDTKKLLFAANHCQQTQLFCDHLKNEGVQDDHIITIALDDRRYAELRNPDKMLAHIDAQIHDNAMYYILLDEVSVRLSTPINWQTHSKARRA